MKQPITRRLLCVAGAAAMLGTSAPADEARTVVRPEDNGAVLDNPKQVACPHPRPFSRGRERGEK